MTGIDLIIEDLMVQLVEAGASDLHIATGQPPCGIVGSILLAMYLPMFTVFDQIQ